MQTNTFRQFLVFTIANCLAVLTATSQTMGTDSEGKSVYEFQKSETFNLPISSADNSAKINFAKKIGGGTQYYGRRSVIKKINDSLKLLQSIPAIKFDTITKIYSSVDSTRLTMAKSWGLNASFKVSNLLTNLAKVETFKPKYSVALGVGRNIDVLNNWGNISVLKNPFTNWNITLGLEKDEILIYDTLLKTASNNKNLWTKSIIANGSIYFPKLFSKTLVGISSVVSFAFGNNIADLKKYQENKEVYIDNNITSLGDYIGRIGDLRGQNSFRSSISLNIFPNSLDFKNDTIQLCIIPYASLFGATNTTLKKLVGFYVNVSQGKSIFSQNSVIKPGIGLGVDWLVGPNGLGNVSIFVGGSLDLHTFFPHSKPKS